MLGVLGSVVVPGYGVRARGRYVGATRGTGPGLYHSVSHCIPTVASPGPYCVLTETTLFDISEYILYFSGGYHLLDTFL